MANGVPDNEKTLVTKLINHYEPEADVSEDYYSSIKEKYPNTDTLITKLINHYEPEAEVSEDYLGSLYSKYEVSPVREELETQETVEIPESFIHKYDPSKGDMVQIKADTEVEGEFTEESLSQPTVEEGIKESIVEKYPGLKNAGEWNVGFTEEEGGYSQTEQDGVIQNTVLYNPKYITDNSSEVIVGEMLKGMDSDPRYSELKEEFSQAAAHGGFINTASNMDSWIKQFFQPNDKNHAIFMEEASPEMKAVGKKIVNYMETGEPYSFDFEDYKANDWVNRALTSPAKIFSEDGSRISVNPLVYSQGDNHFVFPTVREKDNVLTQLTDEEAVAAAILNNDPVVFTRLEEANAFAKGISQRTGEMFRRVPEPQKIETFPQEIVTAQASGAIPPYTGTMSAEEGVTLKQKETKDRQKEVEDIKINVETSKEYDLLQDDGQREELAEKISKDKGVRESSVYMAMGDLDVDELNYLGTQHKKDKLNEVTEREGLITGDEVEGKKIEIPTDAVKIFTDERIEEEVMGMPDTYKEVFELKGQINDIAKKEKKTWEDRVEMGNLKNQINDIVDKRELVNPVTGELSRPYAEVVQERAEQFTDQAKEAGET